MWLDGSVDFFGLCVLFLCLGLVVVELIGYLCVV